MRCKVVAKPWHILVDVRSESSLPQKSFVVLDSDFHDAAQEGDHDSRIALGKASYIQLGKAACRKSPHKHWYGALRGITLVTFPQSLQQMVCVAHVTRVCENHCSGKVDDGRERFIGFSNMTRQVCKVTCMLCTVERRRNSSA